MNKKYINIIIFIAFVSFFIALFFGILSILNYSKVLNPIIKNSFINIPKTRPIHVTFAISWVFLCSVSIVCEILCEKNKFFLSNFKFIKYSIFFWSLSGFYICSSFFLNIFSGKEYIEYNLNSFFLILIGWFFFSYLVLFSNYKNFFFKPIYIYMWVISSLLFIVSYTELYLTNKDFLEEYQVFNIQIQWKAVGSFVASFNMLIYGILYYVEEKINKNENYTNSYSAIFFFFISTLNSFTNYTHHTYHIPQNMFAKYIGFFVSMLEIIILFNLMKNFKNQKEEIQNNFKKYIKFWIIINLTLAILISIPIINSVAHGTYVILAHSMGSLIGIDTYILLYSLYYFKKTKKEKNVNVEKYLKYLNVSLFIFIFSSILTGFIKNLNDNLFISSIFLNLEIYFKKIFIFSCLIITYSLLKILYKIIKWC